MPEFFTKNVEPSGFEKWKTYILGKEDGIEKTPEWAEKKCAVPAETIRELAKLAGTMKPAWLWAHFSLSRKSHGEQTIGAFAALQAMMGYWGTPGAGPSIHPGPYRPLPVGEFSTSLTCLPMAAIGPMTRCWRSSTSCKSGETYAGWGCESR